MTPDELVKAAGEAFLERDRVPSCSFDDCIRAAIAVALEEAAKVADAKAITPDAACEIKARSIAAAIRAMIPKEDT